MPIQIKICCISSINEAKQAIQQGANVLGLVGNMPSGPGIITNELIKTIQQTIPSTIETFLLTSETSAKEIIAHHQKVNTTAIQIVDNLQSGTYQDIRLGLPNIKLIQVIHVIDDNSIQEAIKIAKYVDCILLDSGNPNLKVKELGGTGRTHNWAISKKIVDAVDIPVFLAGGLNSKNVQEAIKMVQPHGIDLCSGVRTDGKLDSSKLAAFIKAVNATT